MNDAVPLNDAVLLAVEDGIARLTLNRPKSLNAFDADLAYAWRDAAERIASADDVRAVVLDAAGRSFCAGGDVVAMASKGSGADLTELAGVINDGIRSLTSSAVPVVAAAHGTTAGGGLGILMCSDYAVVGASSRIGSLYANIGLTPDLSVSAQLARAVGERRALQLVLQDRMLSADEALEWGLVAEVVRADAEADAVRARAYEIAEFWRDGASAAYGQAKRLIRSQPSRTFDEQLAEEAHTIGKAFDTAEARARIAAFAEAGRGARGRMGTPSEREGA